MKSPGVAVSGLDYLISSSRIFAESNKHFFAAQCKTYSTDAPQKLAAASVHANVPPAVPHQQQQQSHGVAQQSVAARHAASSSPYSTTGATAVQRASNASSALNHTKSAPPLGNAAAAHTSTLPANR